MEAYFRTGLRRDALDLKARLHALKRGGGNVVSLGDPEILVGKKPQKNFELEPGSEDNTGEILDELNRTTPADLSQQNELRRIIFDCAATLNLDERKLLSLAYLDKSHAEIAKKINAGITSVGSMLQRVYKKLRPKIIARIGVEGLKEYGITNIN